MRIFLTLTLVFWTFTGRTFAGKLPAPELVVAWGESDTRQLEFRSEVRGDLKINSILIRRTGTFPRHRVLDAKTYRELRDQGQAILKSLNPHPLTMSMGPCAESLQAIQGGRSALYCLDLAAKAEKDQLRRWTKTLLELVESPQMESKIR